MASQEQNYQKIEECFDQWSIYKKIIDQDYMHHKEMYGLLKNFIDENLKDKNFSLIDLGCGDASYMSGALNGSRIEFYKGMDISSEALKLAKENMAHINCKKEFIKSNYAHDLNKVNEKYDIVWSSYSVHHLSDSEKKEFFQNCFRLMKPGGRLLLVDIIKNHGETRNDYLQGYFELTKNKWTILNPGEFAFMEDHVNSSDYPESYETLKNMGQSAGFKAADKISHKEVFAFMSFN